MGPEARPGSDGGARLGLAALVFAVALLARVLFARAGVDAGWPHGAGYRGDVDVWLSQVMAGRAGVPFEAGVPLRPPGVPWLVDRLWDGTREGVAELKTWWRLFGAASAALLFLALVRGFPRGVALGAALCFGLSSAALHLSHSVNSEAPYLVLALGAMVALPTGSEPFRARRAAAFGVLSGLACLVRAEHALFVAAALPWAWSRERRLGLPRPWLGAAAAGLAFVLALVPHHLQLWERVARFNAGAHPTPPGTEAAFQRIERRTAGLAWTDGARAEAAALPAFLRRSASLFVAATVQHRGGTTVEVDDFDVLEEAFGVRPGPLPAHPFVSSYGPLNAYLANGPGATARFGLAPLRRPPPLAGGADRYPPDLVEGLPPERLSLEYLPHLDAFRRGTTLAVEAALDDPSRFVGLAGARLAYAWRGAASGVGGYGVPAGASGVRRPVDMVVPDGWPAALWALVVLGAAAAGLVAGLRERGTRRALAPWLLLLGARVVVVLLFFGYARQGALALPSVALLVALAARRHLAPRLGARAAWIGAGAVMLVLALEAVRSTRGVRIAVDGRPATADSPGAVDPYAEVRVDYD